MKICEVIGAEVIGSEVMGGEVMSFDTFSYVNCPKFESQNSKIETA